MIMNALTTSQNTFNQKDKYQHLQIYSWHKICLVYAIEWGALRQGFFCMFYIILWFRSHHSLRLGGSSALGEKWATSFCTDCPQCGWCRGPLCPGGTVCPVTDNTHTHTFSHTRTHWSGASDNEEPLVTHRRACRGRCHIYVIWKPP